MEFAFLIFGVLILLALCKIGTILCDVLEVLRKISNHLGDE